MDLEFRYIKISPNMRAILLLARSMDRVLLLGLTAKVTRESLLMVICMAMDRLEVAKVSTLVPLKKD